MTKDTTDLLQSAAILIAALVVIVIAAKLLAKFTNRKFARAFAPLLPVIDGTIQQDGFRGMMSGVYEGRPVSVHVLEGGRSSRFSGNPNDKRNLLTIELMTPGGRLDWSYHHRSLHAFSPGTPRTSGEESAHVQALTRAGVLAAVMAFPAECVIDYNARLGRVSYQEDIRPTLAPSKDRFRLQLNLLKALGKMAANA